MVIILASVFRLCVPHWKMANGNASGTPLMQAVLEAIPPGAQAAHAASVGVFVGISTNDYEAYANHHAIPVRRGQSLGF